MGSGWRVCYDCAVVITPFAVGRPWDWLPRFYITDLASTPEMLRNAFNLMAIVGGLRQPGNCGFLWGFLFYSGYGARACRARVELRAGVAKSVFQFSHAIRLSRFVRRISVRSLEWPKDISIRR